MFLTALVFLLLLSVLVLIHELGHFLVAKKFGIKVEEFGWGFPPKIWGKKIGETEYTINALPFGGFVKLYGEDDAGGGRVGSAKVTGKSESKDLKRAFFARPGWQKALVVVAGVVMNVLLAFVAFYGYIFLSGFKSALPLIVDYKFTNVHQVNLDGVVVNYVAPNSPAEEAGIQVPSQVLEVDGEVIKSVDELQESINAKLGEEVSFTWKDGESGDVITETVVPRESPPENEGALGVGLDFLSTPVAFLTYESAFQKIFSGITYTYDVFVYQARGLVGLFGQAVETKNIQPVSDNVAGPVGIFSLVGKILSVEDIRLIFIQILNFGGIMSLSLAFFNILPIPALDGGRLFFILFEMVTRKKVNPRFESLVHAIGFALLMGLIILIIFSDILKTLR